MNTKTMGSTCAQTGSEFPERYPNTINISWPDDLQFRRGSPENLCGIEVYYDFTWTSEIGHNCSQFRNGKSLAQLAEGDCPEGKTPALLLTTCDDVEEHPIETDTYYILVVNIRSYVSDSKGNAARDYYADKLKGPITGITALHMQLDPESLNALLDAHLNVQTITRWAQGRADRIQELKRIVAAADPTEATPTNIKDVIRALESLDEIDGEDASAILAVLQELRVDDSSNILEWVVKNDKVIEHLARLQVDSLEKFNSLTGIARLKNILTFWEQNKNSSVEEFWQTTLQKNAFVLSQVFPFAVVILNDKAYLGGKGIENTGGKIVDFLCLNSLTRNAVLIEIKTPQTTLLSANPYRGDIYNVHHDLCGAIMQVSNYKDSLIKEYYNMVCNSQVDFEAFNPQCLVIAGNTNQLTDQARVKSFELFRNGLRDVQVIAYDELFKKMQILVEFLEGNESC